MLECSLFFSLWRLIWTKISLVDALEEQKETALIEAVPWKGTPGTTSETVLGLPDGMSVL